MFELSHEAHVSGTAAEVWRVLLDFERYSTWTRSLQMRGRAEAGAPIDYIVTIAVRGGVRSLRLPCVVTAVRPARELVWITGFPGILSVRFAFELHPVGVAVRVRHVLQVGGVGSPIARWRMDRLIAGSMTRFTADLRLRFAQRKDRPRSAAASRKKGR